MSDARENTRAVWIRLIGSPLILAFVLGVLILHDRTGSFLPTDLLLFVLGAGAGLELALLLRQADRPNWPWVAALGCGLLAGIGLLAPEDPVLRMELRGLVLAATVVLILCLHFQDTRPAAVEQIAYTFVPLLFIGILFTWTREVAGSGEDAARVLLWFMVTAKASDMGGWIVGKPFGRHKLIPRVSPGKSWEGLAGGLTASVLGAIFLPSVLEIFSADWSVFRRALFGLAVGGGAVVAGIMHSAWKRRLGAKDSSHLLPEIGGVLDMVDSLLLAGPVAYLWLRLGL
ncbi:MAG: phosphatidate cytidylyltransferase [Planctomycetota bacterium]